MPARAAGRHLAQEFVQLRGVGRGLVLMQKPITQDIRLTLWRKRLQFPKVDRPVFVGPTDLFEVDFCQVVQQRLCLRGMRGAAGKGGSEGGKGGL